MASIFLYSFLISSVFATIKVSLFLSLYSTIFTQLVSVCFFIPSAKLDLANILDLGWSTVPSTVLRSSISQSLAYAIVPPED